MDLESIEGVAVIRRGEEGELICTCCNGQPHVYGASLDLQGWHIRGIKHMSQIDDWVHQYLHDRKYSINGKRIRVTIEMLDD